MRIAIIGAGIAGLSAALTLRESGISAVVYDKGRGPGGRTVSKRTDWGSIDLGAQYFTARDRSFRSEVAQWEAADVVAPWPVNPWVLPERQPASAQSRLVAKPRMSALARHLAKDLDLHCGVQISEMSRELGGWVLRERHGEVLGEYDAVLVTAPAPQAQSLLAEPCPALATQVGTARMQPCWAVGLILEHALELDFSAGFPSSGPLGWVARSGSRPDRPHWPETWILHATAAWSEANLEWPAEQVASYLTEAFCDLVHRRVEVTASIAHRWRFARARQSLGSEQGYLVSEDVLCAGDWVTDGRVEGAWLSGRAAAQALIRKAQGSAATDA